MAEPNSTSSSLMGNGLRSTVQTMSQWLSESTPLSTEVGEIRNSSFSESTLFSSLFPDSQVTPTQSSFANSTGAGDDLVLVGTLRKIKTFLGQLIQFGTSRLYNSDGVTTTESTILSSTATNGIIEQGVSTISDMLKGSNESSYINLISGNSTLVPTNITNSTSISFEENGPTFETSLGVFIIMFCLIGFVWSMVCRKEGQHIKELFCGEEKPKRAATMQLDSLSNIEEKTIYENDDEGNNQNKEEKIEEENSDNLYENLSMDEDSDYDNVKSGRRRRRYHDENGNDEENITFVTKKKNDNEEEEEVTYLNE
ncbi:conserved Plasmodium protein, unknown function [Plasmodium sp. gorilla clade G3]|nr:conserved Plasmodium protein, unknown function [Plasmodium sp. gorilla clade G3]